MVFARHVDASPRPRRALGNLVLCALLAACMPPQEELPPENGAGGNRTGGKATGGNGNGNGGNVGSGGTTGSSGGTTGSSGGTTGSSGGTTGSSGGTTGSSGGTTGSSGGTTGSSGGTTGSGGSGAGGSGGSAGKPDGGSDAPGLPPGAPPIEGTFEEVRDKVITNCVFCHPGETDVVKNSDFADATGLYALLTSPMGTKWVPAACQYKILVVPGKPMESLLYLKLLNPPPPNCGGRMPLDKKMPIDEWSRMSVFKWISDGAKEK